MLQDARMRKYDAIMLGCAAIHEKNKNIQIAQIMRPANSLVFILPLILTIIGVASASIVSKAKIKIGCN